MVDLSSPRRDVRVFLSYAHSNAAHEAEVERLHGLLEAEAVDVRWDQDVKIRGNWPRWMEEQVAQADFVLVCVSSLYRSRADECSEPDEGRGVQYEADQIRNRYYRNQRAGRREIIPVILPGSTPDDIPQFLLPHAAGHVQVDPSTGSGRTRLLQWISPNVAVPEGESRLVISVAIEPLGGNTAGPDVVRNVVDAAVAAAEFTGPRVVTRYGCDQALVVVACEVAEMTVIGRFIRALDGALRTPTGRQPRGRARVGVDIASDGRDGEARATALAERLRDSELARVVQRAGADAVTVVVVSEALHRDVVERGGRYVEPAAHVRVGEVERGGGLAAWVRVPPLDIPFVPNPEEWPEILLGRRAPTPDGHAKYRVVINGPIGNLHLGDKRLEW
jgi:hypothetical protein